MSSNIRLGILGWGTAGQLMARAVARSPRFTLAGVADVSLRARADAAQAAKVDVYADMGRLVDEARPEVVYVATPTRHHNAAVGELAAAGIHTICEKPLAARWDDAVAACAAAEVAGIALLVGNTHSYDAPVRELRRHVVAGSLGTLVAVQSSVFTNWRARKRRTDDLDAQQGGGIVLRQGAHQIDIIRLIGGGELATVSAQTFGGVDGSELGYSALARFRSGASAALHYSGSGGFESAWLTQGVGELGTVDPPLDPVSGQYFQFPQSPSSASPTFGLTVATFTDGQAVLTSHGVLAYTGEGPRHHSVEDHASGWEAVLDEMAAVLDGAPAIHSGRWGLATLEASLAVHRAARTGHPVVLSHQVPLPAGH
jgi:phthalate 4,5-cis-dihydrodiol dehydrogenase